jgi:small subunit ribosomal protein S17
MATQGVAETDRAVNRKARTGVVVSDKNDQTIVVAIERAKRHRLYHKVIRRTKRYQVHDPENSATVGDLVTIEECRPISKTKRWRLVRVLTERDVAEVAPESLDVNLFDEMQRSAARAEAEAAEARTTQADAPAGEAETVAAQAAEAPTAEAPAAEADAPAGEAETVAAVTDETPVDTASEERAPSAEAEPAAASNEAEEAAGASEGDESTDAEKAE